MLDLVEIWRVQTCEGWGPYSYGSPKLRDAFVAAGFNDNMLSRPSPQDDAVIKDHMDWLRNVPARLRRCGFEDLTQYFNWFDDDNIRSLLDEDGFSLLRLQVAADNVLVGDRQVLFNKSNSKVLGVHRCLDATPVSPQ